MERVALICSVQKMKYVKVALPLIGLILLVLIFWYAAVPGIVLGILFGGRWERLVSLIASACLILVSKLQTFIWMPYIDISSEAGLVGEVIEFLVAWAWCGFLFYSSYRVARFFRDGYHSAHSTEQNAAGQPAIRPESK